jgi:shikimate kinase
MNNRADGLANEISARPRPLRAVVLVGFMGAGKTSVGRALAQLLGWRFEDLDTHIEASEGRSVAEIFQMHGEAGFREREHAALHRLISVWEGGDSIVAALGGGAFVQAENASLLRSHRVPTVYLDAPVEELWRRCADPGQAARPLRAKVEEFRALHDRRREHYLAATVRFDTGGKTVEQVAAEIHAWLQQGVNGAKERLE